MFHMITFCVVPLLYCTPSDFSALKQSWGGVLVKSIVIFMFDIYHFWVGGGYWTFGMLRKPLATCSKHRTYPSAVSNTVRSLQGKHVDRMMITLENVLCIFTIAHIPGNITLGFYKSLYSATWGSQSYLFLRGCGKFLPVCLSNTSNCEVGRLWVCLSVIVCPKIRQKAPIPTIFLLTVKHREAGRYCTW